MNKLRELFLSESKQLRENYWTDDQTIEQYDKVLAERISWKWRGILELFFEKSIPFPKDFSLMDWGCGTGMATRTFLHFKKPSEIYLHDRSDNVLNFARQKIIEQGINSTHINTSRLDQKRKLFTNPTVYLLSHIINELSDYNLEELLQETLQAKWIFWVEPGTKSHSKKIIEVRNKLLASGFVIHLPCPHSEPCHLFSNTTATAPWCHQFIKPPDLVFHSPFWSKISQQLHLDLRSLPVSFLIAENTNGNSIKSPESRFQILGRPRELSARLMQIRICASDVTFKEQTLTASKNKKVIKTLKTNPYLHWPRAMD